MLGSNGLRTAASTRKIVRTGASALAVALLLAACTGDMTQSVGDPAGAADPAAANHVGSEQAAAATPAEESSATPAAGEAWAAGGVETSGAQRPARAAVGTAEAAQFGETVNMNDVGPEICDGEDNDLNGMTDDGFVYPDPVLGPIGIGQPCTGLGQCGAGLVECDGPAAARCSSNNGGSVDNSIPEFCDGLDNDCDGSTDEGVTGQPLTRSCYTGAIGTLGIGECSAGTASCVGGTFGECKNQVLPAANDATCDGDDEDCDSFVDEDYAPVGCGTGACANTSACIAGLEVPCFPRPPQPDNDCDYVDDDCDGQRDEHYVPTNCGTGVCSAASFCIFGINVPCIPRFATMPVELFNCDGLDNDCDGNTDELYDDGVACTTSTCLAGVPSDIPDNAQCDDARPCTDDFCHETLGCINFPDDTNPPDPTAADTNACTDLVCFGGFSTNVINDTNVPTDGVPCTDDYCASGAENHDLDGNHCLIGGNCEPALQWNAGVCGMCRPEVDPNGWSPVIFEDDFDDGDASDWFYTWWEGAGNNVGWQLDSQRSNSAGNSLYFGNPTQRNYSAGTRIHAGARTPFLDMPPGVPSVVRFTVWMETEAVQVDRLIVDVVAPTGFATPVWSSAAQQLADTDGQWAQFTVDLSDFAGQEIAVGWRFDTEDGFDNNYEGVYLDDVIVRTVCCTQSDDCFDDDDCTVDVCFNGGCTYVQTCAGCQPIKPNMGFVLDFSGSMINQESEPGKSKWEAAVNAISNTLAAFGPAVNAALKLFPTPGASSTCTVAVGADKDFGTAWSEIVTYLQGLTPAGATPMAKGIADMRNSFTTSPNVTPGGQKFMLLITDGKQTCTQAPNNPAQQVIDAQAIDGIETFVLGFGNNVDPAVLDAMAIAGGHPRDIPGSSKYYQANNESELQAALGEIFAIVTNDDCDGIDDDCDGLTDEDAQPRPCTVECDGVTLNGTQFCANGGWEACTATAAELCNGIDDDCNGVTDDLWVDGVGARLNEPCVAGAGVCAAAGTYACPPDGLGEPVCDAPTGTPEAEICDSLDNDCDGVTDVGLTQVCSFGCGDGVEFCYDGAWINCTADVCPPADGDCDGLDDDNNGVIDDLFPEVGLPCDGADSDECKNGQWRCNATEDGVECGPESVTDILEVCGGGDEDCDDEVDEEGAVGCTDYWFDGDDDNYGIGTPRCLCSPSGAYDATTDGDCDDGNELVNPAAVEDCDSVDNDCDGHTDTQPGNPALPLDGPCYTGEATTEGVGVCHGGSQVCTSGSWGSCSGEVVPSTELCDGLDNDCDGVGDLNEPHTDETSLDHPCAVVPACEFGQCYCIQHPQTLVWQCILE